MLPEAVGVGEATQGQEAHDRPQGLAACAQSAAAAAAAKARVIRQGDDAGRAALWRIDNHRRACQGGGVNCHEVPLLVHAKHARALISVSGQRVPTPTTDRKKRAAQRVIFFEIPRACT
jgi:hypothetical protein